MVTNCWEFKKCGRQPGGPNAAEFGVCNAATESRMNGIHGGKNGGRTCWVLAGTLCGGKTQGTYAQKLGNCITCDFYLAVRSEEGKLKNAMELLAILK
jgi:hypothetical protein